MRGFALASIVVVVSVLGSALRPAPGYANPTSIWVLNLNIVNASSAAASCAVPHNCDLTSQADRSMLFASFGTLQTASKGMVQQEPVGFLGTPAVGSVYVVARTDGSMTNVTLNGRGLHCSPSVRQPRDVDSQRDRPHDRVQDHRHGLIPPR